MTPLTNYKEYQFPDTLWGKAEITANLQVCSTCWLLKDFETIAKLSRNVAGVPEYKS